jgi:hypothetical protein
LERLGFKKPDVKREWECRGRAARFMRSCLAALAAGAPGASHFVAMRGGVSRINGPGFQACLSVRRRELTSACVRVATQLQPCRNTHHDMHVDWFAEQVRASQRDIRKGTRGAL